MTAQIRAGAQAPERVRMSVANTVGDPEPLDLTTVSALAVRITPPPAATSPATWAHTVITQTSALIEIEHVFSPGDVETVGLYRVDFLLTVPAGVRRAGPVFLKVIS